MKKIVVLALMAAFLSGCVTAGGPRTVRYPNQASPELTAQFKAAEQLYRDRTFAAADGAFARFIGEAPYTELTDEARFLRGEIAFIRKDDAAAIRFYRESYSDIASPAIEPKARFKTALALSRGNRQTEALTELSAIRRVDASPVLRLRIDSLGAQASAKSSQDSIVWYLRLLDDYAEGPAVPTGQSEEKIIPEAEALAKAKAWVDDPKIGVAEIETLPLKEMKGKRSGSFALYKLALTHHRTGDTAAAERELRAYITGYPKGEYYGQVRLLMTELGGAVSEGAGVAGIAVGVVLPLTGRFSVYGESVLHGIECAAGIYEPCVGPTGLKLVVRDSASTPGGAAAAVAELAANKDVIAIVGPLESADALEAAQRAQELGVPLISLSQREGVAEVGEYTFKNSVSTSSEMTTLAKYAVESRGMKRFSVIYPRNKKGEEYFRLFQEAVKAEGGRIVSSRPFSQSEIQPTNELRGRGAQELAAERTATAGPDFTPTAGYDAIFIPDAFWAAASIVQMMAAGSEGASKPRLLGIARWNDPDLSKRSNEMTEGAIFVDSFYRAAPDPEVSAFVTHFKQAYNVDATLLEALGYDTMRIVADAVQHKGAGRRDSMRDAIGRTRDFPGVAGKTSFNEQGEAVREMWVLTVRGGEITAAK